MATETTTLKSVAITAKAYEIATAESRRRKDSGIPASLTNVISEAVVRSFSRDSDLQTIAKAEELGFKVDSTATLGDTYRHAKKYLEEA
jgi:hypothetical protein